MTPHRNWCRSRRPPASGRASWSCPDSGMSARSGAPHSAIRCRGWPRGPASRRRRRPTRANARSLDLRASVGGAIRMLPRAPGSAVGRPHPAGSASAGDRGGQTRPPGSGATARSGGTAGVRRCRRRRSARRRSASRADLCRRVRLVVADDLAELARRQHVEHDERQRPSTRARAVRRGWSRRAPGRSRRSYVKIAVNTISAMPSWLAASSSAALELRCTQIRSRSLPG